MQLSHESYRVRWIVLVSVWAVAAFAVFDEARLVRAYLDITGQLGLRGAPTADTPLKEMYPAFAADAQTWVRHALALTEGHQIQLRYTSIDNAPFGREVHWNSAWAWTIAGAGHVYHLFTGKPLPNSIERATVWLNPTVLLALTVLLSAWATKRGGAIAGVIVAIAMVGSDRIFEGFFPSYVDHHGLLTVSVFGLMLGAVFMGGGWWQPAPEGDFRMLPISAQSARSAAVFSALAGACGLWVSAASSIPPIALVGGSGLIAVFAFGRSAKMTGAQFDAQAWRTWGRVGAVASVFFYLLEYFPHHLGLRLEVNHPFYALAWYGGGELIATIGEWWLMPRGRRQLPWLKLVVPVLAVCVTPIAILLGGVHVFVVTDPFLSRLHNDYIQEFLPIWTTIRSFDAKTTVQVLVVNNAPLIAGIATLTYRRRESPIVLLFATVATFLFNAMSWWESRWMLNATGVQVCLAIVVLGCWTANWRPALRWVGAIILVGLLYAPGGVLRLTGVSADVQARRVAPKDAMNALARDIAQTLRSTQPQGDITLLTSPNASTMIGYYGRFKTLGTLYWENVDGLKAAAAIFSAPTAEQAASLIRERHVTHIAIVSDENFIAQYFQLLHPHGTEQELKQCFGVKLFADKVVPQWLQMIPYKVPDDLKSLNVSVMLFKVNFQQNLADALYNVALSQIEMGAINEGEQTLNLLLSKAPQAYQPWLRKSELLLARHEWNAAADTVLRGIALAPAADRPTLYVNYAKPFYDAHQHSLAVKLYRAALATQPTPDVECYLAWILATTTDQQLRNGKEAVGLAQEAVKADPTSPSYQNSLAAALAENGQFAEAATAADRALANSRLRNEPPNVQQVFTERLAIIRSGKPLRY